MLRLNTMFLGFLLVFTSCNASASLTQAIDAYAHKDYQTAYKLFLPLAEAGNPYAQYGLAKMYANGDNGDLDYSKAFKWYQEAANQSYGIAQNNLGLLYEVGNGTLMDLNQAKHWYKLACDNRCSKGCKNLQRLEFEE